MFQNNLIEMTQRWNFYCVKKTLKYDNGLNYLKKKRNRHL